MGYSPWGHKESDTTEHHEMDPFNRLVAKQVSGTFKEGLSQKEHVTEIYAWRMGLFLSYGNGRKGTS